MKRALLGASGILVLGLVPPIAQAPPAFASQLGGSGSAVFTETISPPMDTTAKPTTHTFSPSFTGAVAIGDIVFVGTITTPSPVTATSSSESMDSGSGTVSTFSLTGTGTSGNLSGTAFGTWTRVGSTLKIQLSATVTVCSPAPIRCATVPGAAVDIVGQWIPVAGLAPIQSAAFAGSFALQGSTNRPPDTPALQSPPSGGALNGGPGQLFTVTATDPDSDPYKVEFRVTGTSPVTPQRTFDSGYAASGHQATGTPGLPFAAGAYTWSARAIDVNGGVSAWSSAQTFTVVAPPNVGIGEVRGRVAFDAPGLPGALEACAPTTFDVSEDAAALPLSNSVALSLAGTHYVGPLAITGDGVGECANAAAGSGTVTLTVAGENPVTGAKLNCPSLQGTFIRIGSVVTIIVGGSCQINAVTTGQVAFRSDLLFRPEDQPTPGPNPVVPGVNAHAHSATFTGSFLVTPS